MANAFHAIAPEAASCSSSSEKRYYDVFINHRGPDVKHTLATAIHHMLGRKGMGAFLDNKDLELGDPIPQVLQETILNAKVHIAIFSPKYAESAWCLEELLLMLQSNLPIIPVFYEVQPTDLRYVSKGIYAAAFRQHRGKRRYDSGKIEEWKNALCRVSYQSGSILEADNCDDEEVLRKIVDAACHVMKNEPLGFDTFPVGLDEGVLDFESEVASSTERENVRIVGIVGMGGAGKTTLAKELYNRKHSSFSRSCFLSYVRDCHRNSLHTLQKNLLQDLRISHSDFHNKDQGQGILRRGLSSMNVLIVFDDVDHVDQMNALLPEGTIENLGRGSFIIVTTRNGDFLKSWRSCFIYHMKLLDNYKANQLFCKHAFSQLYSTPKFEHLVKRFVKACHGLPLSLKVVGAMMKGRCEANYWEDQLAKLSIMEHKDIAETLKLSYDALDPKDQQMFLDIVCFFIGEKKRLVVSIWYGSGWGGQLGWETLVDRCLVSLDKNGNIDMHDHLRDLGRVIANDVSPSRIWKEEQIEEKIINPRDCGGGFVIRGINTTTEKHLRLSQRHYPLSLKHCMENLIKKRPIPRLQLLVVEGNDFRKKFKALSSHLVWLRWCDFRGKNLPSWLSLEKLSALELYNAVNLEELWQDNVQLPLQLRELIIKGACLRRLPTSIGDLKHLKKIVLHGKGSSPGMNSLPGAFCELGSLEFLELRYFPFLSSLPHHFGKLTNLQTLNLRIVGLKALPDTFKQLTALQSLYIFACLSLRFTSEMVDVLELMTELQFLRIKFCPVGELPHLTKQVSLRTLELGKCELRELPNMDQISKLETLKIYDCPQLQNLPPLTNQVSLRELDLTNTGLKELPNLDQLKKLKTLDINYCPNLTSMPASLGELSSVTSLQIEFCNSLERLPESLGCLSNLRSLQIVNTPVVELGLGNLKSLKSLNLAETKLCSISIPEDCCPSLEELFLDETDSLTEIETLPESVRAIDVWSCKKLKNMRGIDGLSNLERLVVEDCPHLEVLPSPSVGCKVTIKDCPKAERLYQDRGIHFEEPLMPSLVRLKRSQQKMNRWFE